MRMGMRMSFAGKGNENGRIGNGKDDITWDGLCGEDGMGKAEHGMRMAEQVMVAEHEMAGYSYNLNK
jgi:hypothetical protein